MQPQFLYLGLVIMAFLLFAGFLLFVQVSDVKHRRMLGGKAAPSTGGKR